MPSAPTDKRPLVFLGVGIFNTLLDFAFYTFLTLVVFQDNIIAAGLLSGTLALVFAFITHGTITWRGRSLSVQTILKFFAFTGFGMWVIRPILLTIFIQLKPLYEFANSVASSLSLPFTYDFIASTGAFGFMIILVLLYNYLTYDRFVFSTKTP